jgi:hypothetical protein
MTFAVSRFFPAANSGLGQFAKQFNLVPPVSLRALTANVAIAQRYQALNTFRGPLGVAMSPVTAKDASSQAFVQHYRGGDLHFEDGKTRGDNLKAAVVRFKGIHCFGNPGFLKSDSVYAIVSVYSPENTHAANTMKFPDDTGGGLYDDLEQGQDRTDGIADLWLHNPQPLVIEPLVMGSSLLGDSQKVKDKVRDAAQQAASQAAAAEGVPATDAQIAAIAAACSSLTVGFLSALGLTDGVRGIPQTITLGWDDLLALPPVSSKQFGIINFNVESPILTDGDASYKVYFDVQFLEQPDLPSQ